MNKAYAILLCLLIQSVTLFSQSTILHKTIKIGNTEGTVGSILKEISTRGGFSFSYGQDIPRDKQISLSRSRQTVQQFLDEIFEGKIYCVEYGNKIILMKKPGLPEVYTLCGKVVDSESKEPIPGVTIYIPGSDPLMGTVSNKEGFFQLDVPSGEDMVQLSCVGYESDALSPGKQGDVNIELDPQNQELSEVEIVYYQKPKEELLNTAVSTISAKQLEIVRAGSVEEALQGNVAGVHAVRNSGMPGSSIQIKVRGINSLINSDPVYYLDGVYIQSSTLYAIAPNDIEKIEVLKDASGTAKYGASAGNGIVLLHSKKAKNKKVGVTFNYSYGLQKAWKKPELMDTTEFLEYFRLVRPKDNTFDKLDNLYSTDWIDVIFHEAKTENFHVAFFGGNDRSDFYVSSGYFNQQAIINKLELKRYSFKIKSDYTIRPGFTFGEDITFAFLHFSGLKEGCFLNDFNNPILGAMCMPPVKSFENPNLFWLSDEPRIESMYENVELNNNSRKNYALTAHLNSQIKILPAIHYTTRLGVGVYFQDNISFNRASNSTSDSAEPIYGSAYNILDLSFDWQHSLVYEANLPDGHSLNAGLQFEFGQRKSEWIPIDHSQYDDSVRMIADTNGTLNANYVRHRSTSEFSHNAWSGFIQYNFKNRYQVNLDLRRETIDFYDTPDRELITVSDWYPSISLGWIFSEENFFPRTFLSYGKIRYGWGKAGNSPHLDYSFFAKMMRNMDYVYAFNTDTRVTSSANNRMTNEHFYKESIHSHNIGLDLGLWQNKLFFSVDYFNTHLNKGRKYPLDKPKVIIQYINQMDKFGIESPPVAEIRNDGFECELSYKHSGRNLLLDMGLNFTHLRNKVIRLDDESYKPTNGEYDPISIHFAGETAGSFYGYKIDRLFREDDCNDEGYVINHPEQQGARAGDYKFVDVKKDGVIDANDKTVIGNPFPDFTFGLFFNLQFKSFDFSFFFQGSYGNEIFNATNLWLFNPYGLSNWSKRIINSYREPYYYSEDDEGNTTTDLHRFDYYNTNRNLRISDFYVEDGSYLRLKNIQVGYTLPIRITKRVHIQKFRIYLSAQNLLTWTNYSGLDPEVGGWGIDCGIYPQPRVYMAGVNVEF